MTMNAPVVLPPNKQWKQLNQGSLFGSIFSSRNISLEVPGVLSLSNRAKMHFSENAGSNSFEYVLAIVFDGLQLTGDDLYYIITDEKIYTMTKAIGTPAVDSGAPATSDESDGVLWNDGLYVSTSTTVAKLVSGTWTTGVIGSMSGDPHPLCVSTGNNFLLVGDGNLLRKRTTAGVNSVALTLPKNYIIRWIRSNNGEVYIGASDENGEKGAVFLWDEAATAATDKFELDTQWPYSGEFLNGVLHIVTDDGRLQRFNGSGFTTVAEWPIYRSITGNWVSGYSNGSVLQRGMTVINGKLNIGVGSEMDDTLNSDEFFENMPAAIWEYDEDAGLYPKYGLSVSTTGQDYAQMALGGGAVCLGRIYVDPQTGGPNTATATTLLYGARLSNGTATTKYTLGTIIYGGLNRGQFSTTRIEAASITNTANKLWCKFRNVFTADDKILFKYKVAQRDGLPFNPANGVTYTSSTVFTSTSAKWAKALTGDEVTILSGMGAGATAHITNIAENAGTYTITVDEAIPNVSAAETAEVVCDNWAKIETTITSADILGYKDIPIPQTTPSTWIQIKTEMRGVGGVRGVTIEELQLVESTEQQTTS